MNNPPSGTVTFLFTDVEGSTRLWEEHPESMKSALAKHDSIMKKAVESNNGKIVKTTGDGIHAVFSTAIDATRASRDAQFQLQPPPRFFRGSRILHLPAEQIEIDQARAQLIEEMGEEACNLAAVDGEEMSMGEAVSFALQEIP